MTSLGITASPLVISSWALSTETGNVGDLIASAAAQTITATLGRERCTASVAARATRLLARAKWNDPATPVMDHADEGYDITLDFARENGRNPPAILK